MPAWPSSLPAPQIDGYGFKPASDPVLRTQMQVGSPRTRRQVSTVPSRFNVVWDFSQLQTHIFWSWHKLEVADGNSWFNITLHSGAGLTTFEAKFVGVPEALLISPTDYKVQATLEVRSLPLMGAEALAPYL